MATGRVPTTANSPLTAKGDLFGYSTAPARLAVGNDGEQIVADSAATTGLRYQGNYAAGVNEILNSDFSIWQRGTSVTPVSNYGYGADRWRTYSYGTSTATIAQQTFTPGAAPVAGYEGQYFARFTSTNTTTLVSQPIEDVRTFAGQTATFSFWAKSASGQTISLGLNQNFGSGGSGTVQTSLTSQTITTSWVRYSATVAVPSISGKTIGTSNYLEFFINGAINNALDIWGVKAEIGSVATAFQTATGTIQGELAACQRYYQFIGGTTDSFPLFGGYIGAETYRFPMIFPVQMRVAPTITKNGTWNAVGVGQPSATYINTQGFTVAATGTGGGFYLHPNSTDDTFTISAEL
jgi:hypothetical protein